MPSIFDYLLGNQQVANLPTTAAAPAVRRAPSILDTPEYAQDRGLDALQGLAAGLVRAGAPSPYPVDFGQTLGMAGAGVAQGMQGSEDRYLKRAMVNAQVNKAEEEIKNEKAWRDMFSGAAPTAATATAALPGAAAGPAVPTALVPSGQPNDPTNPGNISDGKGGFQSFPTPEAGVAAAVKLAQSYPAKYNGGQPMSLAQIEARWAPPDDGKTPQLRGNKQGVWAGNVGRVMGVDPNVPIDFSNPDTARKFAAAVHVAEQGQQKAYSPDVYDRGVQLASGGAPLPPQGAGEAPSSPVQTDGAAPPAAPGGPVQLAQAPGTPAPAIAPGPAVGGPRSLQDVIQTMPPGVRQMVGAMGRKDGMGVIMKYADPETHVAIDSTTGAVVFAPKTDKSGRYVPVDVAKIDIERQNAASQAKQAAAREEANRIRGANEPLQAGVNGGPPTPTPGYAEQKGAVSAAEEQGKVQPKVLVYQAEQAIKDHGETMQAASKARTDLNDLKQLDTLLKGVETGKMTPMTQEAKAWAKAAGFNLDTLGVKDDVANTQAASSLLNRMTLQMRNAGEGGGMPGSMSDADRAFLQKIPPGLETTPEGRKLIVDYMTRVNQRTIEVANIKNKYVQSGEFAKNPAAMWQKVQEFADSHPLFSDKDQLPAAAPAASAAPIRKYNPATGKIE